MGDCCEVVRAPCDGEDGGVCATGTCNPLPGGDFECICDYGMYESLYQVKFS